MRAWSVIGLLFTAAVIATMPIAPQVTPLGVRLSDNQAQAITYGHHRRVYRRSYHGYYGVPAYYYGGYPPVSGGGGQWYPW
jgi:hypothetical protein